MPKHKGHSNVWGNDNDKYSTANNNDLVPSENDPITNVSMGKNKKGSIDVPDTNKKNPYGND